MVYIIDFGDPALVVGQQGDVGEVVLCNKVAVRCCGVSADAQDFNLTGFKCLDVLLKLNKLARSVSTMVPGVKSEDSPPVVFEYVAQHYRVTVLVGERKIIGPCFFRIKVFHGSGS
jgi:hypothetical protein